MKTELTCAECGNSMALDDSQISNHLTSDGTIDYDQDADHVAISDENYGL